MIQWLGQAVIPVIPGLTLPVFPTSQQEIADYFRLAVLLNEQLRELNLPIVRQDALTPETCLRLASLAQGQLGPLNTLDPDLVALVQQYRGQIEEQCRLFAGGQVPPPEPEPLPPGQAPPPTGACLSFDSIDIFEGPPLNDVERRVITEFQTQLNIALVAAGYQPIEVTGVYDAETCGAVFTLGGSFRFDFVRLGSVRLPGGVCINQINFPVECQQTPVPPARGAPSAGGGGGLGLAALIAAVAIGVGYLVTQS